MKISPIEIDKQLGTPVENEVQRGLREAIKLIRRVGLCREAAPHDGLGDDGSVCAMIAIDKVFPENDMPDLLRTKAINALAAAIGTNNHMDIIYTVVEGGMPATETMFARAIEIAGWS